MSLESHKTSENVLYIGGFGSSKGMADRVGNVLSSRHNGRVEVSTYATALRNPGQIALMAEGATVITHSAGFMSLRDGLLFARGERMPHNILAVAAPDGKKSVAGLVLATLGVKTAAMIVQAQQNKHGWRNFGKAAGGEIAEIIAHPYTNLASLVDIAAFNGAEVANEIAESGTPVDVVRMNRDYYFPLPIEEALTSDKATGHILAGLHDDLPVDPFTFMVKVDNLFLHAAQNRDNK